jgi:PAS domain S-box-containing protein
LRSGVAEAAGVDGSPHLQAISPVRGTRWFAYADIPRDAVYADLVRDTWQALLTGLAGLGTSLVLAWLFARRLAAPIRELGDVARAVKSGNAGVRVSPAGPVEVAAAGEQFNAMLDGKRLADENLRHEQLRFRDLAEQSSDWFWEQDADLRFSWVSGKQPVKGLLLLDDLLGKRRWELPIALDEDEWHAHRAMLARREPFSEFSYRMLAPDGSVRWSAVTGKPIFDAAGGFAGYRGTGRDITDRKLAELATRKSEEQLRLVVDNVPAMIAFFDAGRICRFSNQAYAAYHGLTPAQTVGRSEPSLMSDAGRAAMAAVFDQVLRGQTVRYSVQTEDFRQGQVYLQVALVPHQGGGTEFLGYFVLMNNLTELYLAQAGLRESEERFRAIFEACPVPMVLTRESDGVRRDVNPAWEAALGYARAEAVGNNQARLVTYADPADRARLLDIMGATGRVDAVELHLRRKDGEERVAESWMRRLVLGGQSHLLLITRDVTEERESARRIGELNESLERRVSERTDELSAANRELETFAYSVSHDLRAPLRGIDGYARLLQESPAGRLDEEARHHLERIRRGTRRMGQLIDDLLDLARVTRAVIARSQVDVSALAAEIAAELSGTAPERQVAWNIEPGIVVDADPGLLRIVLENLLGNAWKYSRGTPAARIEVCASGARTRGFEFLVRDNGAGFDMSYADHLFRPFQRLHAASEFEGSGIGLATVQRILQRHGGMIHAEGAVGLGATFMVRTRPAQAS